MVKVTLQKFQRLKQIGFLQKKLNIVLCCKIKAFHLCYSVVSYMETK